RVSGPGRQFAQRLRQDIVSSVEPAAPADAGNGPPRRLQSDGGDARLRLQRRHRLRDPLSRHRHAGGSEEPTLRLGVGMSVEGLTIQFWQFQLPKRGEKTEDYEDASAGDPLRGRFAIADGAAGSSFSALWARLLVEEFVR